MLAFLKTSTMFDDPKPEPRIAVRAAHLFRGALHGAEGVIAAAVEDDEELERAGVAALEKISVFAQHRFDARFFVISRDEEQQAWFGHATR